MDVVCTYGYTVDMMDVVCTYGYTVDMTCSLYIWLHSRYDM